MYQQQNLEQVVFTALVHTLQQQAHTDPFFKYGLDLLSVDQFQNSRMMTLVRTASILFQSRTRTQTGASPEQVLFSICTQVLSVLIANVIKRDTASYNSLNFDQRNWVTTQSAYAAVIDAEEQAFEEYLAQSGGTLAYSPSGYSPKVSDRFKSRRSTPVPKIETKEVPLGPVGINVPDVNVHTSNRFSRRSAPTPTVSQPKTEKSTTVKTTAVAFNPLTEIVTVTGEVIKKDSKMAYEDHKQLIKQQVQVRSTTPRHTGAVEILAGGITFNPFDLRAEAPEEAPVSAIYHLKQDDVMLAMSATHAHLQALSALKEIDTEAVNNPYSYDYRDIHPTTVVSPDTKIPHSLSGMTINSYHALTEAIGHLIKVNPDLADAVNQHATKVVNECLFFLMRTSLYIDDYYADIRDLFNAFTNEQFEAFEQNEKLCLGRVRDYTFAETLSEGVLGQLGNWGMFPKDSTDLIVGRSLWRAVLHAQCSAIELGLDVAFGNKDGLGRHWAFIDRNDAPFFYDVATKFLDNLGISFYYESISIITTDGVEYRIRETGESPTLAVTIVLKD